MAQGYDSDVQLSVGLSLEDVISQSKKLSSAVSKLLQDVDTSKLDKGSKKLIDNLAKAETQAQKLESEMGKLGEKIAEADDYQLDLSTVNKAIDEYTNKLSEAFDERKRLADLGTSINDEGWKAANENIQELTKNLEYYKQRKQELEQHPIVADNERQKVEELKNQWEQLNDTRRTTFEAFNASSQQSASNINKNRQSVEQLASSISKVVEIGARMIGLGPVIDRIRNGISGLTSKFKGGATAANSFGKAMQQGIKKLMSYGLGIASLTSLFNKMRSAIMSGIQTMAKMNNGINTTNAAMTQFTSMLNLVKGSLASAFAPILTYVTPMLSSFMQQLANVITMVGMFIAKLTGAKSYMKATFKSTDYAKSLGGSGGGKSAQQKYEEAVKKAQEKYDKQVAKINEQNANAEAKAAEKNAKAEEKQAKAADKLAKAQEKANNKLAAFDDLNVLGVDNTEDAVDELEQYEATLKELPELELPNLEDFLGGGGGGAGDPFGLEEIPLDDWEWNWDDLLAKAEELGRKLADMLNDVFADEGLAQKIGNAIGNLINMAIRFAYGFVDEFNFRQFGHWLGTLIQEAIETIDWGTLGTTIGKLVNGIADTIIGFFERYNVGTLGQSIATMFNNAINEIDTDKVGEAIGDVIGAPIAEFTAFIKEADIRQATEKAFALFERILTAPLFGGEKTLGYIIGEGIAELLNAAFDMVMGSDVSGAIEAVKKFLSDIFIGALENVNIISYVEAVAIYCIEQAERVYNKIVEGIRGILLVLSQVPGEIGEMASQAYFSLGEVNTKFDEAKQSVHELADSYRKELPSSIKEAKDAAVQDTEYIKIQTQNAATEVTNSFNGMAGASSAFKTQTWNDLLGATQNINDYSTNANTQLESVQTKSEDTAVTLQDMTTTVNDSLASLTTAVDTWYQEMIITYFSYDAWLLMLQEGPLLALTDFFTTLFFTEFDTQMQTWWNDHVLKWFKNDWWNTQIYVPWETYRNTKWQALLTWWDTSLNVWWINHVQPWFKESKWKTEFDNIKKAAEATGRETQQLITQFANDTADAIIAACDEAIEKIGEVIGKLEEAIELSQQLAEGPGGGSGSSSSNGGSRGGSTSNGGGGGRTVPFMPMLDVMHFEDNLGMSAFKFPELATGAVIPPNNKFLAVLGDQKSGMNIETPLATMVEAFRSVMDEYMNPSTRNATMEVDGETFARLMMPHMMDEMHRLGYNTEIIEGI